MISGHMITDAAFYLAAVPAVVVLGLSKGGFSGLGMVALPTMALVVPPLQGAAASPPPCQHTSLLACWCKDPTHPSTFPAHPPTHPTAPPAPPCRLQTG